MLVEQTFPSIANPLLLSVSPFALCSTFLPFPPLLLSFQPLYQKSHSSGSSSPQSPLPRLPLHFPCLFRSLSLSLSLSLCLSVYLSLTHIPRIICCFPLSKAFAKMFSYHWLSVDFYFDLTSPQNVQDRIVPKDIVCRWYLVFNILQMPAPLTPTYFISFNLGRLFIDCLLINYNSKSEEIGVFCMEL